MHSIRNRAAVAVAGVTAAGLLAGSLSLAAVPAGAVSAGAAGRAGPRVPVLHWHACDGGFQCATARVPLDYRHPRGKLISIAVIRHRAADPAQRAGTLFVNGGGPAAQIQGFLAEFPAIPAVLRDRFDIVTFDPRGFGFSTAVRCFGSAAAENRFLAPVLPYPLFPVGAGQTAVFERTYARFGARCARRAGSLLAHDSTADVARDMDLLRRAAGAPALNYIGLSYGTGLGAVYANLFPATVGHMVLDGNLNPVAWTDGGKLPSFVRLGTAAAAAGEMRSFLNLCGRQPTSRCAFSAGTPAATRAKFATLVRRLRAHPVTVGGQTITYPGLFGQVVPPGDVTNWQPAAVQLQRLWIASAPPHAQAARAAAAGRDGAATRSAAVYAGLEQGFAVLCADGANPRNPGDYVAAARQQGARYGGFGRLAAWSGEACAHWPRDAGQDRYTGPWNRRTARTILVIGNTGDPVTAYQNSVAMAHDLARARLLTVRGFGHTEFFNPSTCASDYEFRYLITGALPPRGTVCPQTVKPF